VSNSRIHPRPPASVEGVTSDEGMSKEGDPMIGPDEHDDAPRAIHLIALDAFD
jgi:hypothetical protein